jgi:LmbE family N-acetylglucosaminyl deacetylase
VTLRQTERAEHAPTRFGLGARAFAVRGSPSGFPARPRTKARVLDLRQLGESVVVVAPHPDDESIACGGLIALLARRSVVVNIIVVTDGCGSHPNSSAYPPARLATLRAEETLSALSHLGVEERCLRFCGLPDRFVPTEGSPGFTAAVDQAFGLICRLRPKSLVLPSAKDAHGDHRAAAAIWRHAARLAPNLPWMLEYVVWPSTQPPGIVATTFELEIAEVLRLKQRAVAEHRSQRGLVITDDPGGFVLPANLLARASAPYEIFFQIL